MTEASAYGEWPSPISAELVAAGGVGLGSPVARGDERWWSELRPSDGGRVVLVQLDVGDMGSGEATDVLPAPWSARTRVHEYGGGAWTLGTEAVYFSNWDDQRLYRLAGDGTVPMALTPEPPIKHGWRFADACESESGQWLICVREDHTGDGPECVNQIVAVATDGSEKVTVLVSGTDFVAAPRLSPDGSRLSWIQWNHPKMPWDGTELCVASIDVVDGSPTMSAQQTVAGGSAPDADEAVLGSDWHSTGELIYSTDRSGFWNLHGWNPDTGNRRVLTELEGSEIGGPPWVFGLQPWTELADGQLAIVITEQARDSVSVLDLEGELPATPTGIDLPFVRVGSMAASDRGAVTAVVGSSTTLPRIVELDPASGSFTELRPAEDLGVDEAWFSEAENFDFVSAGGRQSHAFYYAPAGKTAVTPSDQGPASTSLPPLVVMGHGGPTSHSTPELSLKVQYWTSRGIAVVDVNYGGSSGYGRDYRRLLNDSWGLVDVEDCVAAAEQLAASGRVDGTRMAIRGGSAGGFTVLRALQVSDAFSAGTSLYGVADLGALASDTHKFEARYLDGLIGPYPEAKDIYDQRSPINHTEDLSCPLLVMQGSEDEVVPPAQSEAIVDAVAKKGLPHAYLLFEGEQHGFRQAATIVRSLQAELWFYGQVFAFTPADSIDPIVEAVGFE